MTFITNNSKITVTSPHGSLHTYLVLEITNFPAKSVDAISSMHAALAATIVPATASDEKEQPSPTLESQIDDPDDEEGEGAPEIDKRKTADNILKQVQAENSEKLAKGDIPPAGWSQNAVKMALGMLPQAQRSVVLQAAENGGQLGRGEVYKVAHYPQQRSLKGFIRPVQGLMEKLKKQGVLPQEAKPLLKTIYDPAIKTYMPVQGFKIPLEVVVLLRKM